MHYPVVIHKDPASDYGVTVPDLPGCFSVGSTITEAMVMTREAIADHIEGLIADDQPVPEPSQLDSIVLNPEFAGGIFAIVEVDDDEISQTRYALLLADDAESHPEKWIPVTQERIDRVRALMEGVDLDDDDEPTGADIVSEATTFVESIVEAGDEKFRDLRDHMRKVQATVDRMSANHREAIAKIDKTLKEIAENRSNPPV